jgi:soluble lytic murein transglycosylase-like protein
MSFSKVVFIVICGFFGLTGFSIAAFYYQKAGEALNLSNALKSQVTEYQKKESELNNMQKTVEVLYGLSPYEARYYSMIFYDFSKKYEMPWEVYPALVKIESCFNSGVLSKEHAKGMTQVLESTGRHQAEKLGIPFNEGTLWNCVLNMVIGFDFFSEGYAECIGSTTQEKALEHAMKRYCGGPGYNNIKPDAKIYVRKYKSSLWEEYLRVSYLYKGIKYEDLVKSDSLNRLSKPPEVPFNPIAFFEVVKNQKLLALK